MVQVAHIHRVETTGLVLAFSLFNVLFKVGRGLRRGRRGGALMRRHGRIEYNSWVYGRILTERNMHMYSKVTVKCVSKSYQLYAVKKSST